MRGRCVAREDAHQVGRGYQTSHDLLASQLGTMLRKTR